MLQRLRRKFIILNMAMVSVVVVAVLVLIGAYVWHQSMSEVDEALSRGVSTAMNSEREARFIFSGLDFMWDGVLPNPDEKTSDNTQGYSDRKGGEDNSDEVDRPAGPRLKTQDSTIPVAVYKVENGVFTLVTQAATAQLDTDLLEEAGKAAVTAQDDKGTLTQQGLFYLRTYEPGTIYIAFADVDSATAVKDLMVPLVSVGLLTLLLFFLISLYFSRWALRPVEKAWEQQTQLCADVSHELKTPITVILANMAILLKHQDGTVGSQSAWVESTMREAEGMQELVTDLLDLSRAENVAQETLAEDVDFSFVTEGSLLQFMAVAFERNVMIDDDITPNLSVSGTRTRLERLCAILLDNACKYAQEGSTIAVTLQRGTADKLKSQPHSCWRGVLPKGPCAVLTVMNQGEAISPEDLPHLFDRFYRSDKARTRTEGSFGLGLAIAAQTAEQHQGAIMVQSTPEGETSFVVALPLRED